MMMDFSELPLVIFTTLSQMAVGAYVTMYLLGRSNHIGEKTISLTSKIVVVLMALAGGDTSLIAVAKRIYIYKPKIVTMMFMQEPDDGAYRDALSAGVKYVGKYPETSEALNAKCQEIYDAEQARLQYLSAKNSTVLNGSSVIGVYSPKDGMGSTTISISLASTLARAGQNVALLELDAEFGDIATYLNLTPQKTMADLFSNYETFTVSEVEQCMEVLPSGVIIDSGWNCTP